MKPVLHRTPQRLLTRVYYNILAEASYVLNVIGFCRKILQELYGFVNVSYEFILFGYMVD